METAFFSAKTAFRRLKKNKGNKDEGGEEVKDFEWSHLIENFSYQGMNKTVNKRNNNDRKNGTELMSG